MAKMLYIDSEKKIQNLTANIVIKNDKSYYNISHGSKDCWEIRYSIDHRLFKPKHLENKLELLGNNFTLKPILDRNNNIIKDKLNNIYYVISKNSIPEHKKDVYLFLDTNIEISNFKIKTSPGINLLGKGIRKVDDIEYVSPVIEIFNKGWIELTDGINTLRVDYDNSNITIKD